MRYNYKITGQVIGTLRVQKGMSQEVLSGLAGIARGHLGMIETGNKNANVETLWRISGALGIRLSELIRIVEDRMQRNEQG